MSDQEFKYKGYHSKSEMRRVEHMKEANGDQFEKALEEQVDKVISCYSHPDYPAREFANGAHWAKREILESKELKGLVEAVKHERRVRAIVPEDNEDIVRLNKELMDAAMAVDDALSAWRERFGK